MGAWNNWFHVSGTTYGAWLPGDSRGWRTRKHRVHVEGDYRNPPPAGASEGLFRRSREVMKRPCVRLGPGQRKIAGKAFVEMLVQQDVELIVLAMEATHYHLLGRFPPSQVRQLVGRAKKHAYHTLRDTGHRGKLWAVRCHVLPIADRSHQLTAFEYIRNHGRKGAWVWTYRDGLYWSHDGAAE